MPALAKLVELFNAQVTITIVLPPAFQMENSVGKPLELLAQSVTVEIYIVGSITVCYGCGFYVTAIMSCKRVSLN